MRAVLLTIGAITAAQGQNAQKSEPLPIVFDDWWNVDFVQGRCEFAARNAANPCPPYRTPRQVVKEFENEVEVAFASEPACHGLSLFHFTPEMATMAVKNPRVPATDANGGRMARPHWSLMFDLDGHTSTQVGREWTLVDSPSPFHSYTGHITTPEGMMRQICRIVWGVGGKTEDPAHRGVAK
jgi:hypothetical protein